MVPSRMPKARKGFRGLRHDLLLAFGLILIALLALLGFLFPGPKSFFLIKNNLLWVVVCALALVLLAFYRLRETIIVPLIKIRDNAKRIAEGDLAASVQEEREDEIGELGQALNQMTSRIKQNMEELRVYSEKTEAVNVEINKRIMALSSLLHISNLISQNAELNEIIQVGLERCLTANKMTLGCLILKNQDTNEYQIRSVYGHQSRNLILKGLDNIKISLGQGLIGKAILSREPFVIDKDTKLNSDIQDFREVFMVSNAIAAPILSRDTNHGLLIVGSNIPNYILSQADRELVDLSAMQIAIAIENTLLTSRVEKLEIMDGLTGLYNAAYIRSRLDEEIRRAISFQRPCAFLLFSIDRFDEFHDQFGDIAVEQSLVKIGTLLKEKASDIDKVARFADSEFALILPEKNKRQAIEIAEELRRKMEFIFSEEEDLRKRLTVSGAVTENPVDGMTSHDLIDRARQILLSSVSQGGNRIHY